MSYNQGNSYSNSFTFYPDPEAYNRLFEDNFHSTSTHSLEQRAETQFIGTNTSLSNRPYGFLASYPSTPKPLTAGNNFEIESANYLGNSNLFPHPADGADETFHFKEHRLNENDASFDANHQLSQATATETRHTTLPPLPGLHPSIHVGTALPNNHGCNRKGITDPFLYTSADANGPLNWMTGPPNVEMGQRFNSSQYTPADQTYWPDLGALRPVNPSSFRQHWRTDVPSIPPNNATGLGVNNPNHSLYQDAYEGNTETQYNNWNAEVSQMSARTGVASTPKIRRPTYHPYARRPATTSTTLPPSLSWSVVAPNHIVPTTLTAVPIHHVQPNPSSSTAASTSMAGIFNAPTMATSSMPLTSDPNPPQSIAQPFTAKRKTQLLPAEELWEDLGDQGYACRYAGPAEPEGCQVTASTRRNLARHMRIHSRMEVKLGVPPQDRVAYNGLPEELRWMVVECKDENNCAYYRAHRQRWKVKTMERTDEVLDRHYACDHGNGAQLSAKRLKAMRARENPALTIQC